MLIKFQDIVGKYKVPKGIIHIGAHKREEDIDYKQFGLDNTIWIEGNPELCEGSMLNYIISDINDKEYEFHITNNGQSSSILELDKHLIHHPQIQNVKSIMVHSKRMDWVIDNHNIDMNQYDFLNIDIQGAELLALKGFGDKLNFINYIYTEVNTNYLYKDCALIGEIDEFLQDFTRVETSMTNHEWGDALYIRK